MNMAGAEFDYVVVGAGAAGCVLAGRLAAGAPRRTVLLIEYGGRDRNPLLYVPKGFYYTLRGDRYLYRYATNPVGPAGNHEVWLRGRVLGGSAAVNGMMWTRGAAADWDGLADRGNPGWAWSDVLPAYKAIEDHSLGAADLRGAGGPLGVSVAETTDPVSRAIVESAVRHGWRHVADFNGCDEQRIGPTASTIRNGRRTTSYTAFVRPALSGRRTNLTVATRTRAIRLLLDGRRVIGVRVSEPAGAIRDITAREEVIVCAGAIETPLLLERSGIGRPDVLRAVGIEPVLESPNVGMRLIEQRGVALQVTLKQDIGQARRLRSWPGRMAAGIQYLATHDGQLATAGYDLARHAGILFMGYPIRPATASSVHVSGPDPEAPPVIDARFLEADADRAAVAPVLAIVRDLLATSPVAGLIAAEEFPGPGVATRADTVAYSLDTGTGIYHAVGSAAMGDGDGDVTDSRLRVRGVEALRVADASVLPVQVSGNTAAPAMLVGYRAADFILAGR
jgi:choline dehydrogenase